MANSPTADSEVLARTRRIETRLTQLMLGLGITTQAQRPVFERGSSRLATMQLPSPHSSAREIHASIPEDFTGLVDVMLGDKLLFTINAA